MTDERDDEILGRALSRAIETQDPAETPYERSRLAVRPLRRGLPLWQTLGVAAALVLAIAFGTWFTHPGENLPAAASATPAPSVTASPAVTGAPQAAVPQYEPVWVYFTRDGLPPIGAIVNAHVGVPVTSADQRIGERLMALAFDTKQTDLPAGTVDPLASVAGTTSGSGGGLGIAVRVDGDLATLDFQLTNGWGVRGTSMAQQLVQQIVYTTTEEASVRRVLIREHGKTSATIDQLVITKPLMRDDVSGYHLLGSAETLQSTGAALDATLTSSYTVDDSSSLARFVIDVARTAPAPAGTLPQFSAKLMNTNMATGKFEIEITVPGGSDASTQAANVDHSPLRWIAVGKSNTFRAQTYRLGLDDQRPWRAYVLSDPARIVVEIGGNPQAISDRIAVTAPVANTTIDSRISRTFTLSGEARTFEANVVWRMKDSTQKVVASEHTTASLGTSALWGTFATQITLPATVTGNVTLELYEVSPKDGTEQGLVAIPLIVR